MNNKRRPELHERVHYFPVGVIHSGLRGPENSGWSVEEINRFISMSYTPIDCGTTSEHVSVAEITPIIKTAEIHRVLRVDEVLLQSHIVGVAEESVTDELCEIIHQLATVSSIE